MLRVTHSFFVLALYLTSSVLVFSQNTPAPIPEPEVIYGDTSIEWPAPMPDRGLLLTLSGPGGLYTRQEHPAGSWGLFSLVDNQGQARPDGLYRWELVIQAGWDAPDQVSQVQSGWFEIQRGRVVAEGPGEKEPVVVEEMAPAHTLYLDNRGRVGVGTSVPGAQLHLKGADPGIAIEDTQAGGREYQLRSLEKGDGSLGLFDQTTGKAGWLIDNQGRMGVNTSTPTSTFTVDGYIETTKGFLVNGRPVGGVGFGLIGGAQPLSFESSSNNFFGTGAGAVTTGTSNSFFGGHAGAANTSGSSNSIFGNLAGHDNTTGNFNAFFGDNAGHFNLTASFNSFFGTYAGHKNQTGEFNSFFGEDAGFNNISGSKNSFFGEDAGFNNQTGTYNSFFGEDAGYSNTTGTGNSFFGRGADTAPVDSGLPQANNATAIGAQAYVTKSDSLVLGSIAGVNGALSYVNVGIGVSAPARQLHLRGPNAVFRMDRNANTAAFILCRTDDSFNVWKSFIVGTDAYGVNDGEFIISDSGTGAGGASVNRMTIQNDGDVLFSANVYAPNFIPTSSIAFKTNVRSLDRALDLVNRLRGVRFDWKSTGEPALGLIAEEVEQVIPEVVSRDGKDGNARGVNYSSLVAVLVEAAKEQQATIQQQQSELASLKAKVARLEALLQGR